MYVHLLSSGFTPSILYMILLRSLQHTLIRSSVEFTNSTIEIVIGETERVD